MEASTVLKPASPSANVRTNRPKPESCSPAMTSGSDDARIVAIHAFQKASYRAMRLRSLASVSLAARYSPTSSASSWISPSANSVTTVPASSVIRIASGLSTASGATGSSSTVSWNPSRSHDRDPALASSRVSSSAKSAMPTPTSSSTAPVSPDIPFDRPRVLRRGWAVGAFYRGCRREEEGRAGLACSTAPGS